MAAASIAGSAATALANRTPDPLGRKIVEAVAGAFVGVCCGPWAADLFGAAGDHARVGIAFLTGAAGTIILSGFLEVMKSGGLRTWFARLISPPH